MGHGSCSVPLSLHSRNEAAAVACIWLFIRPQPFCSHRSSFSVCVPWVPRACDGKAEYEKQRVVLSFLPQCPCHLQKRWMWGPNGWGAILLVNCNPSATGQPDEPDEQSIIQEGPRGMQPWWSPLLSSSGHPCVGPLGTHAGHS